MAKAKTCGADLGPPYSKAAVGTRQSMALAELWSARKSSSRSKSENPDALDIFLATGACFSNFFDHTEVGLITYVLIYNLTISVDQLKFIFFLCYSSSPFFVNKEQIELKQLQF